MPSKRKNPESPFKDFKRNRGKQTNNKKKPDPSLNLVLKRLDKFDKRFDALDRKIDENDERYQQCHTQLLTGMDVMAKNYEQFGHDSAIIDAEHRDLKRDVETLKKCDMEKAAAIDKIEKEIDKLKAA